MTKEQLIILSKKLHDIHDDIFILGNMQVAKDSLHHVIKLVNNAIESLPEEKKELKLGVMCMNCEHFKPIKREPTPIKGSCQKHLKACWKDYSCSDFKQY